MKEVAVLEEILIGVTGNHHLYSPRGLTTVCALAWCLLALRALTRLWLKLRWEMLVLRSYKPLSATVLGPLRKQMRPTRNWTAGILIKTRTLPQERPFLMLLKLAVTQEQHGDDEGLFKKASGINILQTEKKEMGRLTNFPPTLPPPGLKQHCPCYKLHGL